MSKIRVQLKGWLNVYYFFKGHKVLQNAKNIFLEKEWPNVLLLLLSNMTVLLNNVFRVMFTVAEINRSPTHRFFL